MENDEVCACESTEYSTRDRFAKLILGTAAGFIVSRLVENGYDALVVARRNK